MSEKVRYILFALFLFLTQILGMGIVPMGLFALSLLMIFSPTTFLRSLRYTPIFFFVHLSFLGSRFLLCVMQWSGTLEYSLLGTILFPLFSPLGC